jgi:uncharacterized protein YecT (DUF1311 family)
MKRMLLILILIIGVFGLTGCQGSSSDKTTDPSPIVSNVTATEELTPIHGNYGVYDMTGEFIEQVHSNPIDRDYQDEMDKLGNSPEFSTQSWDHEMNIIYKKLLTKLNDTEKEILIESQKGWLQYHLKESDFVYQTFFGRKDDPIFGSMGRSQMVIAVSGRLRDRTLQLMEYYWILENEVEFAYTGAN